MKECSELATIQTYKPFDVIYAADNKQINQVHIVLNGRLSIIQYLNINATYRNGHEHVMNLKSQMKIEPVPHDILQLICMFNENQEKSTMDLTSDLDLIDRENIPKTRAEGAHSHVTVQHTKSHFVEIGELRCGSVFGIGEHMEDRVIAAKHTEVQCLLIPQYWLLQKKQNAGNIWHRAKLFLDFTLPSRQEVFQYYLQAKKWKNFKNKLIKNSERIKPITNTTKIEDVPILCRLNDSL
ncbi:uncharacterized protein LOC116337707 [Contarinia nasturtii]|uniref:uncharacterized protein LOC116337707 n=1 Tax=Contarinia nasturtii TaxID=265458 RepID=UPI0012D4BC31|nr:uncharacterized protein LOC116337707 [Contarinia nasturtii]XP_031618345.1 uncharacterized protein LOC116337707 [Contarinia nasturtii]